MHNWAKEFDASGTACLKEIAKSEAKVAEATNYVLFFCGAECYAIGQPVSHYEERRRVPAPAAVGVLRDEVKREQGQM